MTIAGRLVLVTGASSGIGAATARAVARRGGRVLLLARRQSVLEEVANAIRSSGGEARVYGVDLADASAVADTVRSLERDVGVPDVLVNNAGAGRWLWMEETSPEEAVQMMASPYFGAFNITRAILPAMLRRRSGHIVNITSPAGFVVWPGAVAYSVARWAMRGFSEALRAELRGIGVRVTLFTSGLVSSPYFAHNPGGEDRVPGIARLFRTLTPDEVAAAIVRAVERQPREVIIPPLLKLTIRVHRVIPGPVEWAVLKTSAARTATASRQPGSST